MTKLSFINGTVQIKLVGFESKEKIVSSCLCLLSMFDYNSASAVVQLFGNISVKLLEQL